MVWINIILLSIGALVLAASLFYSLIYVIMDITVMCKKKKTKTTVTTNIDGVREVEYSLSPKMMQYHNKVKGNFVYAKLGLVFGLVLIVAPTMHLLFGNIFETLLKLSGVK